LASSEYQISSVEGTLLTRQANGPCIESRVMNEGRQEDGNELVNQASPGVQTWREGIGKQYREEMWTALINDWVDLIQNDFVTCETKEAERQLKGNSKSSNRYCSVSCQLWSEGYCSSLILISMTLLHRLVTWHWKQLMIHIFASTTLKKNQTASVMRHFLLVVLQTLDVTDRRQCARTVHFDSSHRWLGFIWFQNEKHVYPNEPNSRKSRLFWPSLFVNNLKPVASPRSSKTEKLTDNIEDDVIH
jgi:hypothetical protein